MSFSFPFVSESNSWTSPCSLFVSGCWVLHTNVVAASSSDEHQCCWTRTGMTRYAELICVRSSEHRIVMDHVDGILLVYMCCKIFRTILISCRGELRDSPMQLGLVSRALCLELRYSCFGQIGWAWTGLDVVPSKLLKKEIYIYIYIYSRKPADRLGLRFLSERSE